MEKQDIQNFLKGLNKDNLHILFFNYSLRKHWFNPILLITKFYYQLCGKPKIDHICHISKFDGDRYYIFEANVSKGMIENDLIERLEKFEGNIYLVSLGFDSSYSFNSLKIDKNICRQFENEFRGRPYDIIQAVGSAVDNIGWFKKFVKKRKQKGFFCSYLVAELMTRLNYKSIKFLSQEVGGIKNIAPYELFNLLYHGRSNQEIEINGKIYNQNVEKRYATSTKNIKKNILSKFSTLTTKLLIILLIFTIYTLKSYNENLNEIKKIVDSDAFNYQEKENRILISMSKALENEKKNIFLSLLAIEKGRNNYNFVDIITSSKKTTFFGDITESVMREKIRKNFRIVCQNDFFYHFTIEVPINCIDRELPINTSNLFSVYGFWLENQYLIIASCYDEKCDQEEIKNIFTKIYKGL